jgi:glucose/mannose-6-phosphate isomerase
MITIESLQKIDTQKMYDVYNKWPEIAKNSFQSNFEEIEYSEINHIVFAGMGGSGSIGSIFSSILSKTNMHVSVVKGYTLPKTVDNKTLVITTSVSGNTIETLTILDSAKMLGCKILACSSGGKMEQYCKKNKVEYRKIPFIHSPRSSFTSFLYSMLKILHPIIPISKKDVNQSIIELEKLKKKISSENITLENPAIELAEWITEIPLIYYPAGLEPAAIRFKNSLQENSKMHAITEDVIEACHNGIVSWEQPTNILPILIQGSNDYVKTLERWKIIKEFFQSKNIEYKEIVSIEGTILTKLMNLIYLLDYSTIYRAALSGIDPSPIYPINFIKKRL